jgi:hypothetical protein
LASPLIGGFRRVQINFGETLQELAARELGDASLWVKIAEFNKLAPPYISADGAARVARYGGTLLIPGPSVSIKPGKTSAEDIFGKDIALPKGVLTDTNGDFSIIAGRENLKQALEHLIRTDEGELIFHSTYGCKAGRLRGEKKDPANVLLIRSYLKSAALGDDRVQSILNESATPNGDSVTVEITVETTSGHPVDVSATVG